MSYLQFILACMLFGINHSQGLTTRNVKHFRIIYIIWYVSNHVEYVAVILKFVY